MFCLVFLVVNNKIASNLLVRINNVTTPLLIIYSVYYYYDTRYAYDSCLW